MKPKLTFFLIWACSVVYTETYFLITHGMTHLFPFITAIIGLYLIIFEMKKNMKVKEDKKRIVSSLDDSNHVIHDYVEKTDEGMTDYIEWEKC